MFFGEHTHESYPIVLAITPSRFFSASNYELFFFVNPSRSIYSWSFLVTLKEPEEEIAEENRASFSSPEFNIFQKASEALTMHLNHSITDSNVDLTV